MTFPELLELPRPELPALPEVEIRNHMSAAYLLATEWGMTDEELRAVFEECCREGGA